jgi:hypothetical protein
MHPIHLLLKSLPEEDSPTGVLVTLSFPYLVPISEKCKCLQCFLIVRELSLKPTTTVEYHDTLIPPKITFEVSEDLFNSSPRRNGGSTPSLPQSWIPLHRIFLCQRCQCSPRSIDDKLTLAVLGQG